MKPVNRTLLIEQNRALVSFALAPLLRRWADVSDADRADVNAAGLRALVVAADNFDPDKGVQFSSYAVACIQFAGRKALASRGEWKARRAGIALASLDAPLESGDGTTARVDLVADPSAGHAFAQVFDDADDAERAEQLWAWIKASVTPAQWEALRLCYADGQSGGDVADRLGMTRQGVSGRLQTGLARLQKAAGTKSGRRVARRLFRAE